MQMAFKWVKSFVYPKGEEEKKFLSPLRFFFWQNSSSPFFACRPFRLIHIIIIITKKKKKEGKVKKREGPYVLLLETLGSFVI